MNLIEFLMFLTNSFVVAVVSFFYDDNIKLTKNVSRIVLKEKCIERQEKFMLVFPSSFFIYVRFNTNRNDEGKKNKP